VLGHLKALGVDKPFSCERPRPRPPKLVPTRLSEIPHDVRMRAARSLIDEGAVEGTEAQSMLAAAVWPSETVYWVPLSR
jgi:hypothetical protein